MDILTLAQRHVPLRKVSGNRGGEYHGPCPACGTSQADPAKSDRFIVWPDKGGWMCRNCGAGDEIEFLRRFENMSCPEAHASLGRVCSSTTCPALGKCRGGQGEAGRQPRRPDLGTPTLPKPKATAWRPAEAKGPGDLWRLKAAALVERAHLKLLETPEQLAYLASRGLPMEAVKKYRLGWIPEDFYRPRSSWGLPEEISDHTHRPKKLWVPRGILIPYFDGEEVHRIRIRQPDRDPRYYWLPGSGDDVLVVGGPARAHVVVESDLDALLVAWAGAGMVAAVPLGTCNAKPKTSAAAALAESLCILVALDFEPRTNPETGKAENPGGKAARWWAETFPRSVRWPVPAGKDPGEYFQAGGNLRAWIEAGLPPGLRVVPQAAPCKASPTLKEDAESAGSPGAVLVRAVSAAGRPLVIVPDRSQVARAKADFPGETIFTEAEVEHLCGLAPDHVALIHAAKDIFDGAYIAGTRPLGPRRA